MNYFVARELIEATLSNCVCFRDATFVSLFLEKALRLERLVCAYAYISEYRFMKAPLRKTRTSMAKRKKACEHQCL